MKSGNYCYCKVGRAITIHITYISRNIMVRTINEYFGAPISDSPIVYINTFVPL